jgi:hypothetical protein
MPHTRGIKKVLFDCSHYPHLASRNLITSSIKMKPLISSLLLVLFCLQSNDSFSQHSFIGKWKFAEIRSKDSLILSTNDNASIRNFVIKNKKLDMSKIPSNLLDTINRLIDKEVKEINTSYIELKPNKQFEISENEMLIPKAIPGIATGKVLSGKWEFDNQNRIITFQLNEGFSFQYQIVGIQNNKLQAGIIYTENQAPRFVSTFLRN